jgi:hypothetical protein
MKIYIRYSIILFTLLIAGGCENILDKPIQGLQVKENYFATEEECQRAVLCML